MTGVTPTEEVEEVKDYTCFLPSINNNYYYYILISEFLIIIVMINEI